MSALPWLVVSGCSLVTQSIVHLSDCAHNCQLKVAAYEVMSRIRLSHHYRGKWVTQNLINH